MKYTQDQFLGFLYNICRSAAENAAKMEALIFEDPSSSIIKARVFAEEIIKEVYKLEKIEDPYISTLYDKINHLATNGYFTPEIQQAFDTIRLSGNKAAHDGQFNDITVAFRLHKEMYKIGVWFCEVYSTKNDVVIPLYQIPKPRLTENVEELVKKQIHEFFGTNLATTRGITDESIKQSPISELIDDDVLPEGQSYLVREINRLKDSSQEAIENASHFSVFKDYLHVERKIQKDLVEILQNNHEQQNNLILLCGSVGDGKSHLLAYIKSKYNTLVEEYTILNDATESFSPNKNALETLEDALKDFSDGRIENSKGKVILAINMGVLHNFIFTEHKNYKYEKLKQFVMDSKLFSSEITTTYSQANLDLLSFGDYHPYELTQKGAKSSFYAAILEKVFNNNEDNPFYAAFKKDEDRKVLTMVHDNFRYMQNKLVQEQIIQIVIRAIIEYKLVISARAFLNFIADILIPDNMESISLLTPFDILSSSLPNLLFTRRERSQILEAISTLDPIHIRSETLDQLAVELNTLTDWSYIKERYHSELVSKKWMDTFESKNRLVASSFEFYYESFIRTAYLSNQELSFKLKDTCYEDFLKDLYSFNVKNKKELKSLYEKIKTAIFKWRGSPKKDYIYMNKPTEKFRLAQKLTPVPSINHIKANSADVLESFKSAIRLVYKGENGEDRVELEIDFPLYKLLTQVLDGYRPNKKDEEDAIKFVEFVDKLMKLGEKEREILVYFPMDQRFYSIKRDDFGSSFVFERESR